ncbi:hypothetical protein ACSQ67_018118 [Phaseolus vulgaris]
MSFPLLSSKAPCPRDPPLPTLSSKCSLNAILATRIVKKPQFKTMVLFSLELLISVFDALWDPVFQLDIFEHVGVPPVLHCLAGFNFCLSFGSMDDFGMNVDYIYIVVSIKGWIWVS